MSKEVINLTVIGEMVAKNFVSLRLNLGVKKLNTD